MHPGRCLSSRFLNTGQVGRGTNFSPQLIQGECSTAATLLSTNKLSFRGGDIDYGHCLYVNGSRQMLVDERGSGYLFWFWWTPQNEATPAVMYYPLVAEVDGNIVWNMTLFDVCAG